VLRQTFVSGETNKHETAFQNIERGEPNRALFEIPNAYTVVERAPALNGPMLPDLRPVTPAPSNP